MKDVPRLGRVGRGLQSLEGIALAAAATAIARHHEELTPAGIGHKLRASRRDDRLHGAASVRVLQTQAQLIGSARLQKHRAGCPVVQPKRVVSDLDRRIGADGRSGQVIGTLTLKAVLQGHRAVQIIVAGDQWGRVRALVNDRGEHIKEAGPAMPVEILGLQGTPQAGDKFAVAENESRAREIAEYRQRLAREKAVARHAGQRGSLEQMMTQLTASGLKEFPLVIKGDVQGSIEAIAGALDKISTEEVRARIVHSGAGAITEGADLNAEEFGGDGSGWRRRFDRTDGRGVGRFGGAGAR